MFRQASRVAGYVAAAAAGSGVIYYRNQQKTQHYKNDVELVNAKEHQKEQVTRNVKHHQQKTMSSKHHDHKDVKNMCCDIGQKELKRKLTNILEETPKEEEEEEEPKKENNNNSNNNILGFEMGILFMVFMTSILTKIS
jgi:hypothetical protein